MVLGNKDGAVYECWSRLPKGGSLKAYIKIKKLSIR